MTDPDPQAGRDNGAPTLAALLEGNVRYAQDGRSAGPDRATLDPTVGRARAGLAVVTCMDARIDANGALGLGLGDAVVLRNPGGQVDEHALAGLVLGVRLLGVRRILLIRHTRCAMASTGPRLRGALVDAGTDVTAADSLALATIDDQDASLAADVRRVREEPALAGTGVDVHGLRYDVDTRLLTVVVP